MSKEQQLPKAAKIHIKSYVNKKGEDRTQILASSDFMMRIIAGDQLAIAALRRSLEQALGSQRAQAVARLERILDPGLGS